MLVFPAPRSCLPPEPAPPAGQQQGSRENKLSQGGKKKRQEIAFLLQGKQH